MVLFGLKTTLPFDKAHFVDKKFPLFLNCSPFLKMALFPQLAPQIFWTIQYLMSIAFGGFCWLELKI